MPISATISITKIGNGYIVADAANDLYGGSEWRFAESVFHPTLDDLAAAMPAFVKAAVEGAAARDKEMRELAEQAATMALPRARDVSNQAQRQSLRDRIGVTGVLPGR